MDTKFLIVGESSSGKDTLCNRLEKDGFKILKSYATRPRRANEGHTHIFINPEASEFFKQDMIAWTKIGKYEYFATMPQFLKSDVYIIDPNGVSYLRSQINDIKIVVVYILVQEEERRRRAKDRGDDEKEMNLRFMNESGQFKNFRLNADFDYCICNHDVDKAYKILKTIIETEKE